MSILKLIKERQGTIVDVRTRGEFESGNAEGSVNIPLQEIIDRIEEVKALPTPLILCCASGGRSGQVHSYLSRNGIECYNAGSWMDVNYVQSQTL